MPPKAAAKAPVPVEGAKALSTAALQIRKKYGDRRTRQVREHVVVSTGSVAVDWGLRIGGLQVGRVYEFIGPPGAGKSTLAISCMIEHLKQFGGRGVAYVDMEDTFDEDRATAMGLDCSETAEEAGRWLHAYPEHSEHVSDMTRDIIKTGAFSCVVVDSIGAMESDRTLQKKAEDAADAMGRNAKIITQMTKALSTLARLTQCTVILVNQPRASVGSMSPMDVSSGPKMVQHATTAKLQLQALGGEENVRSMRLPGELGDLQVSIKTRIKFPRLKSGLPGRVAEVYLNRVGTDYYGPPGFDVPDEALSLGVRLKIIKLGGSYYTVPGAETRFNGRAAALVYLRENPLAVKAVRDSILFDKPAGLIGEDDEDPTEGAEADAG